MDSKRKPITNSQRRAALEKWKQEKKKGKSTIRSAVAAMKNPSPTKRRTAMKENRENDTNSSRISSRRTSLLSTTHNKNNESMSSRLKKQKLNVSTSVIFSPSQFENGQPDAISTPRRQSFYSPRRTSFMDLEDAGDRRRTLAGKRSLDPFSWIDDGRDASDSRYGKRRTWAAPSKEELFAALRGMQANETPQRETNTMFLPKVEDCDASSIQNDETLPLPVDAFQKEDESNSGEVNLPEDESNLSSMQIEAPEERPNNDVITNETCETNHVQERSDIVPTLEQLTEEERRRRFAEEETKRMMEEASIAEKELMEAAKKRRIDLEKSIQHATPTKAVEKSQLIPSFNQEYEKKIAELQGILTNQRKINGKLENQMETCTRDNDSLREQLRQVQIELEQAMQQSEERKQQLEKYVEQLKEKEDIIRSLQQKSSEDEKIRRKLHNELQELKGNIRVYCRVKPSSSSEVVQFNFQSDNQMELFAAKKSKTDSSKMAMFSFDKIFQPSSSQEEIFREITGIVQSAVDGYNTCIFAYGQTGSGKTYTMEGPSVDSLNELNKGVIPRSVEQVFASIEEMKVRGWNYTMECSFIEIYNETIRDLLDKKEQGSHSIKHDADGSTYVTNVKTVCVETPQQVYELLKIASEVRTTGKTNMNDRSSRSHSIFQMKLLGHNNSSQQSVRGVLNLVDLAGSERLSQTGATGERLKEAQHINKSLSCLSDVIFSLANKSAHVPYRNSKLTYLLQNYLGGNSKTLMLVTISQEGSDVSETLGSLRFATKVNSCELGSAKRQITLGK